LRVSLELLCTLRGALMTSYLVVQCFRKREGGVLQPLASLKARSDSAFGAGMVQASIC